MKPKFKLRKYPDLTVDYRWLHWEMVAGNPFFSTHPRLRNRAITQGSIVSLTADAFWGEKTDDR